MSVFMLTLILGAPVAIEAVITLYHRFVRWRRARVVEQ